jgi:hypothetical protein
VVLDCNLGDFLDLGYDLFYRLKFDFLVEIFFFIFGNSSFGLTGFSSRLGCFSFGLGYGSDNEPLFWADFKPLSSRKT